MARFPFGIPTGWFQVASGRELAPGQVVPLRYFGRDLVLFRTESGEPHLLDAFCPHLGAHLGHGGKVRGERLVCPFHAWELEGSGRCVHVPYAERQPRRAAVRPWPLEEHNGLLFAWHDRAGRAPLWDVPLLPEHGDPEWSEYHTGEWRIRTSAQDMAENQVDAAHFLHVHGAARMPTIVAERHGHRLLVRSTAAEATELGVLSGRVEVNSYGLGVTVIRFIGLFETLLAAGVTPIDDEHAHLRLAVTVRKVGEEATRAVGEAFLREVHHQLEEDTPIWENKAYVEHPLLVDGDGPIGIFRAWSRQFYPELTEAPTP